MTKFKPQTHSSLFHILMNHFMNQKAGLNFTTAQPLSISSKEEMFSTSRLICVRRVAWVWISCHFSSWASAKWLHLHLVKYKCPIVVKQEYSNGSLKKNLVTYKILMHHFTETSTREKILMKQTGKHDSGKKETSNQANQWLYPNKQLMYMSVSISVIWILKCRAVFSLNLDQQCLAYRSSIPGAECFYSCNALLWQKLSYRTWIWSVKFCRCWHKNTFLILQQ